MGDRSASRASAELSVLDAWRQLVRPAGEQPKPGYTGILIVIALLNLSAISAIAAAALPDPAWKMVGALVHVALVPGALLAFAVAPTDEVDLVEWLALAFGLGMLLLVAGGLALVLIPGPVGQIAVVAWTAVVSLGLATFAFKRSNGWRLPATGPRSGWLCALLVVLVAGLLRLPGLGYSEFQGDETEVLLRATGVVQGLADAVFYHGKGPGEIVAVAVPYGLTQRLSEDAARLPFALAGIGGALAFFLVARRLLGTAGGLAAGLLLAVNGYFIAFSRIVQYQSLVLLLGMLAIWCAVRWSQGGSRAWPALAGALAAGAALAHFDALFVLPPIALAALWRTGWRGLTDRTVLAPWLAGAIAGIAVLALFYVPYLDSPLFSLLTDRVENRVGAGGLRNNLPSIVASGVLYLGTVFPLLVAGLASFGVLALVARRAGAPPARVWVFGLVWALLPLAVSAFIARKPGTHVHVATGGLMLLAAAGFAAVWADFPLSRARGMMSAQPIFAPRSGWGGGIVRAILAVSLVIGLALSCLYVVPVYLQTTAELVRENKVADLPLTWRPPGGYPAKERFGFPYQAGWKAAGVLFENGTLAGTYDANEQPQVTYWYTRGAWRCSAAPRYYLIAESVQDEIETPERTISTDYHPIGRITVAGEPKLRIYERGKAAPGARPVSWAVEDLTGEFERQVSAPRLDPGPWARGVMARDGVPMSVRYGDDVQLLGYQVLLEDPRPGGVVRVDLFWLPFVSSKEQHRIDVQLGRTVRIGDGGGPACDKTGDERNWTAGQPFTQRVSIPIAASATAGAYPLLVSVSKTGAGGGALTPAGPLASDGVLVEIGQVEISPSGVGDGRSVSR